MNKQNNEYKQGQEFKEIIKYINNIKTCINDEDIEDFKQWCIKNHYEITALECYEIIQEMMKERNEEIKNYYLNLK